ncbi:hypothetical protein EWM64_g1200 [Hericium alpestre]|uniref:Uncharacterized protein n=1 Tax=Hericium alpestre TaxID=135208 RepID=A0A4Z0A7T6_9AGAM|nr:hypothetical protein EWM64_g1200 [Hericium alpestre]
MSTTSPAAYSSCSPTPTLTISPSTTDSADSIFDERTIQMPTIADPPSPMPMKMDATYAYAGELPFSVGGFLSEGGISIAWDGLWTTHVSNVFGAAH